MSIHNSLPGFPNMVDDGDGGMIPAPANSQESSTMTVDDEFAGIVDYFGTKRIERYTFPDGKQYIEFKILNEGDRVKYESATQQDVQFNRRNDNAAIKIDASGSRHELIKISAVAWKMAREIRGKMQWLPFSSQATGGRGPGTLEAWLSETDPKVVNELYLAIRKANPFLVEEETAEILAEEIASLQERHAEALKREAQGKNS